MAVLVVMYLALGIFMAALAVPLIMGRVKPNGYYGFRIPVTMNNPDIWYPANSFAGRILLWVAVVFTLASIVLAFVPGISVDGYALACVGVLFVGLAFLLVRSLAYINRLAREKGRR
jgi:hypothetical protein